LEIYANPAKELDEHLAFGHFFAGLAHVPKGRPIPPDDMVRTLGREAICICLHRLKAVALVDAKKGSKADGNENRF
jgi:hypothetical protein